MILFFDTETTGLPLWSEPSEHPGQPYLVQYAGILADDHRRVIAAASMLVKPDGWEITEEASKIHGITQEMATRYGEPLADVLAYHSKLYAAADLVVCHNVSFDARIMKIQHLKLGTEYAGMIDESQKPEFCTMKTGTNIAKVPHPNGRAGYKWPKLVELHQHFFGTGVEGAHDALEDVRATMRCYHAIMEMEPTA